MSAGLHPRLLALLASAAACACSSRGPAPAPRKLSEVEVQVALHRAAGVHADAPCRYQTLNLSLDSRASPGIVALCAPASGTSTVIVGPHVVLAERHSDQLQAVASAQLELPETHCALHAGDLPRGEAPRFELMTWGVPVARGHKAIGVRFSCTTEVPDIASETRLYLLERSAQTLLQIFDQRTGWTRIDRVNRRHSVTQGHVAKQATTHGGHFDLALETTTLETDYAAGSADPTTLERKATQLFVFDGDHYVPAPVE